ncbi:hypothetical protein GDO86_003805, partial [Hymenochirus boettgeri]
MTELLSYTFCPYEFCICRIFNSFAFSQMGKAAQYPFYKEQSKWFQKAESDLDYIEQKLEFEIRKSLPEDSSAQENPVKLLEQLSTVKLRFKTLSSQIEKIAADQQKSVDDIQTTVRNTLKIVQHLQQQSDFQVSSFSEEEHHVLQQIENLAFYSEK